MLMMVPSQFFGLDTKYAFVWHVFEKEEYVYMVVYTHLQVL